MLEDSLWTSIWTGSHPNLCNRKQCFIMGRFASNTDNVAISVALRFCLGPLLSMSYTNDFPNDVKASTVSMYADDTSLSLQPKDIYKINYAMNETLKRPDLWKQGNTLLLKV